MMWLYILAGCISVIVLHSIKKYLSSGMGKYKCECKSQLNGKLVIITGNKSGIGKATALELARRGAEVILACKGNLTAMKIFNFTGKSKVYNEILDLTSFESILKFSLKIYKSHNELYALIHNADVFGIPHSITNDGFEETFQANYLGPFFLTCCLLHLLKNSKHARIVNVSSLMHDHNFPEQRALDQEEVNGLENEQAYEYSKLCLNHFTYQLAKNLKDYNISANCVDPEDGAQGVIHAVLSPFLENKSGFHFSHTDKGTETKLCQSEELELWDQSYGWSKLQLGKLIRKIDVDNFNGNKNENDLLKGMLTMMNITSGFLRQNEWN